MSGVTVRPLITIEEFEALPQEGYQLHFGELVEVGQPTPEHFLLQRMIRECLAEGAGSNSVVSGNRVTFLTCNEV